VTPFGKIVFCALAIGLGTAWLFFADAVSEWQIRCLQSQRYRLAMRVLGGIAFSYGAVLAWAFLTGRAL
jgi:hypothetical protein